MRFAPAFNPVDKLGRNTPSLMLASSNHLLMWDGAHFNLENQAESVISNPQEMGADIGQLMSEILSCEKYREAFRKFARFTSYNKKPGIEHVTSALMVYYTSEGKSPTDFSRMISGEIPSEAQVVRGFNLFMGKAQCGTCHFVPEFNGVKPPYTGSEFEVLGVPSDKNYRALSPDSGRFLQNPVPEMFRAFRTPGLKFVASTAPYMHNGVFGTLEDVLDFYNGGGGLGRGLDVDNQTLSQDSLFLTTPEINDLIAFMKSLGNADPKPVPPATLPVSSKKVWNTRVVGGRY